MVTTSGMYCGECPGARGLERATLFFVASYDLANSPLFRPRWQYPPATARTSSGGQGPAGSRCPHCAALWASLGSTPPPLQAHFLGSRFPYESDH